jgi:hypothetical protein
VLGKARTVDGPMMRLGHDAVARCRVVFPLTAVFAPDEIGDTRQAGEALKTVVAALAQKLGLEDHYDIAAVDLARLNFLPAVKKEMPFGARVFPGDLLDWRDLDVDLDTLDAPAPASRRRAAHKTQEKADTAAEGSKRARKPREATTEAGRKLARWDALAARRFQLALALRDHAGDQVRGDDGDKVTVRCPFDAGHSNAGDEDDAGFFAASAAPGRKTGERYVAHCQHNSCEAYNRLDMLARLVEDKVLPGSALVDPKYFLGEGDTDELMGAALPAFDVETQLDLLEARMDALPKNPARAELDVYLGLIAACQLAKADQDLLLKRMWDDKKVPIKAARTKIDKMRLAVAIHDGESLADSLVHSDGQPFEPPADHVRIGQQSDRLWIEEKCDDSWTPRATPFQVIADTIKVDEGRKRAMQVGVYDPVDGWAYVDLSAGDCSDQRRLCERLSESGLKVWDNTGARFVQTMVRRNSGRRVNLVSRAGLRFDPDDASRRVFVLPTGHVLPARDDLMLNSDWRIEAGRGGELADWTGAMNTLFSLDEPSAMKLVMLAGLCGPLFALAGLPSMTISLEGPTSTGKSTMSEMAAAMWGSPTLGRGLVRSAHATSNASFGEIVYGSGTMLVLDEFNSHDAKARKRVVMHSSTARTRRGKRNAEVMVTPARWEPMVLMVSAENGFAESLLQDSEAVIGGLTARAFPVITDTRRVVPPSPFQKG